MAESDGAHSGDPAGKDRAARRGEEFRDDERRHNSLPRDVIKRLTVLNPWRSTLAILETVGLIAMAVAVALTWWHPLVVIPAVVFIAMRQQALFILAHDAAHYRLYKTRWLNDVVGRVIGGSVGISMCGYRVVHRLHHNHLYGPQDPDIAIHGGYPRGRAYLVRKLAKDLCGLTAHKNYAYFFGAPFRELGVDAGRRPMDDTSPAMRRAALRDRSIMVAGQVFLLAAAVATGWWVEYLALWVLPLVTVLQPILRLRAITEHGAVSDLSSPLTAARTNTGPGWLLWLLYPHHVNYHVEHHMYPAIPHYNLPACHREMMARGILDRAEVLPVFGTLRRIFGDPRMEPLQNPA